MVDNQLLRQVERQYFWRRVLSGSRRATSVSPARLGCLMITSVQKSICQIRIIAPSLSPGHPLMLNPASKTNRNNRRRCLFDPLWGEFPQRPSVNIATICTETPEIVDVRAPIYLPFATLRLNIAAECSASSTPTMRIGICHLHRDPANTATGLLLPASPVR
jgi:hypothetical protein